MKDEKFVTLAILTYSKAQILKTVLENEGIEAFIHNINLIQPVISSGVRIRIKESDLPRALSIIESSTWLADNVLKENTSVADKPKSNTILIPIDFSENSFNACKFGFNFAAQIKAEIVLINVYFSPLYMPSLQYVTEGYGIPNETETGVKNMMDSIHGHFKGLTEKINKMISNSELPEVKYTCILREGIPEEEILSYAREEKPLMIVMGTRGESAAEYGIMGSVTAEVIERSPVFVYTIPQETATANFKDFKKVAFMTSFDQRDLVAFDSLIASFKNYDIEICFVHINSTESKKTWNEIKLNGIQEYFHKQYPHLKINYNLVNENEFFNNLDEFVKGEKIDVLCVANYKRNVFARLFNPSVAKKMIFHSKIPILVIK